MRCLIVHNLASGPHSDEIFTFIHALLATGDEVVMRCIGEALETEEAVADARSFDRIVVSGGDGTVANVLDHLRDCGVPILVFPSGTANLYFQNVGNAPDAAALAQACRAGITAKVDMGELFWVDESGETRRHGFINIAGSGFDATIMEKAAPTKNDIGEIAYVLSALSTPEPQVAHFTIEHDAKSTNLTASRAWWATPPASRMKSTCSPIAAWTMAHRHRRREPTTLVGLLPTVAAAVFDPAGRGLGRPQFKTFQAKTAKITCTPSLGMQFDGEVIPNNSGVFGARVLRNALISSLTSSRTSALIPKSSSARASHAPCCRAESGRRVRCRAIFGHETRFRATSGYRVRSRAIFGHCTRLWATSGRFRPFRWKNLARRRQLRPDVAREFPCVRNAPGNALHGALRNALEIFPAARSAVL